MTTHAYAESMERLFATLKRVIRLPTRAWTLLRALSGDDAYERYLEHLRDHHGGVIPLDRAAFYMREQERRYGGGPTSCC